MKELGKDLYSLAYYGYYIRDLSFLNDKAYLMLKENQNSQFFYKSILLFTFQMAILIAVLYTSLDD